MLTLTERCQRESVQIRPGKRPRIRVEFPRSNLRRSNFQVEFPTLPARMARHGRRSDRRRQQTFPRPGPGHFFGWHREGFLAGANGTRVPCLLSVNVAVNVYRNRTIATQQALSCGWSLPRLAACNPRQLDRVSPGRVTAVSRDVPAGKRKPPAPSNSHKHQPASLSRRRSPHHVVASPVSPAPALSSPTVKVAADVDVFQAHRHPPSPSPAGTRKAQANARPPRRPPS